MTTKPINLTKKAVGDGKIRLSECGTHVTNGHWAIKRSLLRQAALLTSVESAQALFPRAEVEPITAEMMSHLNPCFREPITYRKTGWVNAACDYHYRVEMVLFVGGEDDTSQVWVNRRYVELFKLETFTAEAAPGKVGTSPCLVGEANDWDLLVMPGRNEYQPGLR